MKRGEFDNIDSLLNELNLIPGTVLYIGGKSNFFDCCHFNIKKNINNLGFKEGWINSIHVYLGEDENDEIKPVIDLSITLKIDTPGLDRPTMNVNKSWFDKNVSTIHIWSWKDKQYKTAYVVTRSEEHCDYVEKVFFNKEKAEEYCKPFNEDENSYHKDITKIEVTL